jgi:hypothetical protein
MKNTKKKTITKTPVKPKKPHQMDEKSLLRTHDRWMKNIQYGISQILELSNETQQYILFCLLQDTLYNTTTNPIFSQLYKQDLYTRYVDEPLVDVELSPLNRKRVMDGLEELITGGGRRKFVGVLNSVDKSFHTGEY